MKGKPPCATSTSSPQSSEPSLADSLPTSSSVSTPPGESLVETPGAPGPEVDLCLPWRVHPGSGAAAWMIVDAHGFFVMDLPLSLGRAAAQYICEAINGTKALQSLADAAFGAYMDTVLPGRWANNYQLRQQRLQALKIALQKIGYSVELQFSATGRAEQKP